MTAASRRRQSRHVLTVLTTAFASLMAVLAGLSLPALAASGHPRPPLLISIKAAHARGRDQLVIRFSGRLPAHRRARYVPITNPEASIGTAAILVTLSAATSLSR